MEPTGGDASGTFELLALTYSEFDNKVGPQLRYQYPLNVLSVDAFEELSEFVIVGKHLCGKCIAVRTEKFQFANYSVAIDNKKYDRNALLFAVGVVLRLDADVDVFKPLLRRFSASLVALELEREYLFQPASKSCLQGVLQSAYEQLRDRKQAMLPLDDANTLVIDLLRAPRPPPVVGDSDVPVLLRDRLSLAGLPWDISVQHLLVHIHGAAGNAHVKRLARLADMDIECVKRCLQVLVFCGCVAMTDPFHFNNVYALTPLAVQLLGDYAALCRCIAGEQEGGADASRGGEQQQARDADDIDDDGEAEDDEAAEVEVSTGVQLLREIIAFAAVPADIVADCALPATPASLHRAAGTMGDLLHVLLKFRHGVTVREVVVECVTEDGGGAREGKHLRNLDIKRLVAVLQARGVVSRVSEYPVYAPVEPQGEGQGEGQGQGQEPVDDDSSAADVIRARSGQTADAPRPPPGPLGHPSSGTGAGAAAGVGSRGWGSHRERVLLSGNYSIDNLVCAHNVGSSELVGAPSVCVLYK